MNNNYEEHCDENKNLLSYNLSNDLLDELQKSDYMYNQDKSFFMNLFGNNAQSIKKNQDNSFYYNLYEYYYRGGFLNIIFSKILEIISLVFGVFFMCFIFILLDWNKILKCGKENDIQDFYYFQRYLQFIEYFYFFQTINQYWKFTNFIIIN